MQVVGETTQQMVWIATGKRKIRINEILIIEDPELGTVRGEVIETLCYNKFIPLNLNGQLMESKVLQSLSNLGYDISSNEISIGRLKFFYETAYPVSTGSVVRVPSFEEVEDLLVFENDKNGLVLGEIKSTEGLYDSLPIALKDVAPVNDGDVVCQKGVPLIFPIKSMHQYPHIGVFGGSGSGKSYGIRVIIEEIMKLNIPTLIFDPHYEMLFDSQGTKFNYEVVKLGIDVGVEFSTLTVRDLVNLLGASHHLTEAMVNAVEMLHKRNDSLLTFTKRLDNLIKAIETGKKNIDDISRDKEGREFQELNRLSNLLDNYGSLPLASLKGIQWRLKRLENSGLFNYDITKIEANMLLGKTVVIQGPVWLLGIFATYVIGYFYHKRRQFKDGNNSNFYPPFMVITDEAHNFAPKGYDSPAKSVIKEIAQEGRKYGVFLLLATQRPTLLDETVTAQLNTKLIFRTVRGTDIATIREETDLTEQEGKRLPYLRSGDVFVSSAVFGRTIAARVRVAKSFSPFSKNPFDELNEYIEKQGDKNLDLIKSFLPFNSVDLNDVLQGVSKEGIDTVEQLNKILINLAQKGQIIIEDTPFGDFYRLP